MIKGFDKWLTTQIYRADGFDIFYELLIESFTEEFYIENEDLIHNDDLIISKWISKIYYDKSWPPGYAAPIIERALRRYKKGA